VYGIFSVKVSAKFFRNFLPLRSKSSQSSVIGVSELWTSDFCPGDGMALSTALVIGVCSRLNCGDVEITAQRLDEWRGGPV